MGEHYHTRRPRSRSRLAPAGACPSATTPSPVALAEVPTGAPSPCVPPRGPWRTPAAASVKGRVRVAIAALTLNRGLLPIPLEDGQRGLRRQLPLRPSGLQGAAALPWVAGVHPQGAHLQSSLRTRRSAVRPQLPGSPGSRYGPALTAGSVRLIRTQLMPVYAGHLKRPAPGRVSWW